MNIAQMWFLPLIWCKEMASKLRYSPVSNCIPELIVINIFSSYVLCIMTYRALEKIESSLTPELENINGII